MNNPILNSDYSEKNLTVISRQNVLEKDFTVYGSVENPLFLAKDVAEWIDYAKTSEGFYNVSMMLKTIDDDEKLTINIVDSENKAHNQSFVTENGLYEILMLSRKPIAKQFKKEVKKILHQIRLTGGYTVPRTFADALRLAAEQQERIAIMQPKADVYDQLVDRSKCINFRDFASKIGFTQNEFMTILKSKYIYKNSIGEYRAYSEYQKYFTLRTFPKGVDKTGEQLMLNMDGITYFTEKYKPGAVAESFIEKGEAEYQKIMDNTASKLIEKAIENCPKTNHTALETFTFEAVAKLAGKSVETIKNYCIFQNYINESGDPTLYGTQIKGYLTNLGAFTENGKNAIVSAFAQIHQGEKGMKKSSLGLGE